MNCWLATEATIAMKQQQQERTADVTKEEPVVDWATLTTAAIAAAAIDR